MEMKTLWLLQTSESTHPATQCNIPEHFKIQQYRCEYFISCNISNNGDNSWHQNSAGFLWANRKQSFFEHSVHLDSHFISLTKSKKSIKMAKSVMVWQKGLQDAYLCMDIVSSSTSVRFTPCGAFRPHYGPGIDSACNSGDYQDYLLEGKAGWCVGLTTEPTSCADCV